MNAVWIDEEVDAMAQFRAGLTYPILRAIRWDGRRIDFASRARVEKTTRSLLYRFDEGTTRYAIRFEPERQKWFLEAIDDSGLVDDVPSS
jgi:hypothetical protein